MTVKITSALALTKDQQKDIQSGLSKKVGADASFVYEVDPRIIGGLRVTVDSKRYDFSLAGKLSQVEKVLSE